MKNVFQMIKNNHEIKTAIEMKKMKRRPIPLVSTKYVYRFFNSIICQGCGHLFKAMVAFDSFQHTVHVIK